MSESEDKSQTAVINEEIQHLLKRLRLQRPEEQSSVSQVAIIEPPSGPECPGEQEIVDEAARAIDAAVAYLAWALRNLLECQSQGSITVLSTEQEAAFDLALELVKLAIR